jgi:hypothetical protein
MLPMFVANPNAVERAATPKVPACRYAGEWSEGSAQMYALIALV